MENKKHFMEKHMDELIKRIREPIQLADALFAKKHINKEMYDKIKNKGTKHDKTREIYDCLNSEKRYVFTYNWLKKNETDVIKEMEKSDKNVEARLKKRARHENEDETDDSLEGFPDFKMACTFAKLEKWVSTPEISQKLMSDLERKLNSDGMAVLETELKRKEPKNILSFNAYDIDKIRSNGKLRTFIREKEKTEFPPLTYDMFFKKGGDDESLSQIPKADTSSQKSIDMQDTYTDEMEEQIRSSNLAVHKERHQNEHMIKSETPGEYTCGSMIMQETGIHKMNEQPQRFNVSNALRHKDESLDQDYQIITKEKLLDDGLGSMDTQDTHIDGMNDQLQTSNDQMNDDKMIFPSQNEITSEETPLDEGLGSMDMQVANTDDINEKLQRPPVTPQEGRVGSKDAQDTYNEGIEEEHQTSNITNVPSHGDKSPRQNEQMTRKKTLVGNVTGSTDFKQMPIEQMDEEPLKLNLQLDDRCGNVNMQQSEPAIREVNPAPHSSKHLQQKSLVSASENTQSIGTDILAQKKDTAMQAQKKDVKAQIKAAKKKRYSQKPEEKRNRYTAM